MATEIGRLRRGVGAQFGKHAAGHPAQSFDGDRNVAAPWAARSRARKAMTVRPL